VIQALRGKTVHQLIAEGQARLGSAAPAPAAKVEKKEVKKEEPKKKVEEPKKKVEEIPKE
jgi:ribosomal protein L12E/L44/L45/RPP1/RPP2